MWKLPGPSDLRRAASAAFFARAQAVAEAVRRSSETAQKAATSAESEQPVPTTSVAMGSGGDECKAAADYVTTDVDDDGIWNAFAYLGLIEG